MDAATHRFQQARRPTFAELFTPKLITILQEGYGWAGFKADVFAGLTVAIVAAPLSMAIAIASGASPERESPLVQFAPAIEDAIAAFKRQP